MSFHQDPKTHQVVIHCSVCEEPIVDAEDGHVNWNVGEPFVFNHYECSDPDVFNGNHYTFNTTIAKWVESLTLTYPLPDRDKSDTFDLQPDSPQPRYPHTDGNDGGEWTAMSADELVKQDLKKGRKK